MWSVVFHCVLASFVVSPTQGQGNTTEPAFLTYPCNIAEHQSVCKDTFFNATILVPAGNKELFCKTRATFSTCLESAVCTCQYPTDHPLLENAYKDIMRNNYEFTNQSCETINTDLALKPGIACTDSTQNSGNLYRIVQTTASQPFIVSLKENCSGIGMCFTQRDKDFEVALFNKSLSAYCSGYAAFFKCYEMKVCECNMQADQSTLLVDDFEKGLYTDICSIITGVQSIIPEIACGGTCSLSEPEVTCTHQFESNIAVAKEDEDICRHLVTYAECYNRLVCECGLYQRQSVYTAVAIARYTFDVKSNCGRFSGVVFPSMESGFPCPSDTKISPKDKILSLNTSQEAFVTVEEELCHGVTQCFTSFDMNGSLAFYNKDLKAICQVMYEEIKCLEDTSCDCGTLHTRFSGILMSKRNELMSVCGQTDLELPPPIMCADQSMCASTSPIESCSNILNRQAQSEENDQTVLCENYFNHDQCIKEVSCNCDLLKNGSSSTTFEIYNALTKNAAALDSLGCLTNSNKSSPGLDCNDTEPANESERKLKLNWFLSTEKVQLVGECPSLKACFEQDDAINGEALNAFDYKRVCRNQLNTIKCMEKSFCECGFDKMEGNVTALQERIIAHNMNCSKYAPFGNKRICNDDVCLKAKTMDVCSKWITESQDLETQCIEYTNYLFCVFDVACSCDLVKTGMEASAEMIYRNTTEALHLMLAHQCSLQSIPVSLFQEGFECFDMTSALPVKMGRLQFSFVQAPAVHLWTSTCPAVAQCATQYDVGLTEALNVKNFDAACLSTTNMVQCSQQALSGCGLSSTPEAAAFNTVLVGKLEGCTSDNVTQVTDQGISNLRSDPITGANSSQLLAENARAGKFYQTISLRDGFITSAASLPWKLISALLIMTSTLNLCQ